MPCAHICIRSRDGTKEADGQADGEIRNVFTERARCRGDTNTAFTSERKVDLIHTHTVNCNDPKRTEGTHEIVTATDMATGDDRSHCRCSLLQKR